MLYFPYSTGGDDLTITYIYKIVINCQSLKSKQAIFGCFVDTHNPDIIFGTESWLSPSISSSEVFPHGYCVYRKDRSDGYGGVCLACCNKMTSREISITTQSEIVAYHITLAESQSLIVCFIYRPPNNDISYLQCLCSDLEKLLNEYPDVPIWIAGDLNLPNINWDNNSVEGNSYHLSLYNIFLDF